MKKVATNLCSNNPDTGNEDNGRETRKKGEAFNNHQEQNQHQGGGPQRVHPPTVTVNEANSIAGCQDRE